FSSRRRHTRLVSDWSSDVCSSDLVGKEKVPWIASLSLTLEQAHDLAQGSKKVRQSMALSPCPRCRSNTTKVRAQSPVAGVWTIRSEERRVGKECRAR